MGAVSFAVAKPSSAWQQDCMDQFGRPTGLTSPVTCVQPLTARYCSHAWHVSNRVTIYVYVGCSLIVIEGLGSVIIQLLTHATAAAVAAA